MERPEARQTDTEESGKQDIQNVQNADERNKLN